MINIEKTQEMVKSESDNLVFLSKAKPKQTVKKPVIKPKKKKA